MKFSIITPTYKRPEKLERAIISVLAQKYENWEIIIVNDSPDDITYDVVLQKYVHDERIRHAAQDENRGVNSARNRGLDMLSSDSDFIVLLDDDDYLVPGALENLHKLVTERPDDAWIVTNRTLVEGKSLTDAPKSDAYYHYARDYLIGRRVKGDATHCIKTLLIKKHHLRFAAHIRQAEEWIFFFQLGTLTKFFYHNINTTLSDGYDTQAGLNFRYQTKREQFNIWRQIIQEGHTRKILHNPYFLMYLLLRLVRIIVRST